jgi:hypothetical protein
MLKPWLKISSSQSTTRCPCILLRMNFPEHWLDPSRGTKCLSLWTALLPRSLPTTLLTESQCSFKVSNLFSFPKFSLWKCYGLSGPADIFPLATLPCFWELWILTKGLVLTWLLSVPLNNPFYFRKGLKNFGLSVLLPVFNKYCGRAYPRPFN